MGLIFVHGHSCCDSGHPKIRNKGIANIFNQMGLVEAWGSGIKRILNAAEEYGLPKPRFQEFDNMFRVELFRNSFPMIDVRRGEGVWTRKTRCPNGSWIYIGKEYKGIEIKRV